MKKRSLILGIIIALSGVSWLGFTQYTVGSPEQQTQHVTSVFAVENMTCAACPITVKKAMARVEGVESIAVDFGAKTATAVFDPTQTNANAIAQASSSVGFPARLKKGAVNE